jgi:hypothetical protein
VGRSVWKRFLNGNDRISDPIPHDGISLSEASADVLRQLHGGFPVGEAIRKLAFHHPLVRAAQSNLSTYNRTNGQLNAFNGIFSCGYFLWPLNLTAGDLDGFFRPPFLHDQEISWGPLPPETETAFAHICTCFAWIVEAARTNRIKVVDMDNKPVHAAVWRRRGIVIDLNTSDLYDGVDGHVPLRRNLYFVDADEQSLLDSVSPGSNPELRVAVEASIAHHIDGLPPPPPMEPVYPKSELWIQVEQGHDAYQQTRRVLAEARQILETPWSRPENLTLGQAKSLIGDEPRPWLTDIVHLMDFGESVPDKIRELLDRLRSQISRTARNETCNELESAGYPAPIIAARRQQAAAILFEAAKRHGKSVLIGSRDRQIDDGIPPHYFDKRRKLGYEDNSIETDSDRLSDEQFGAEFENRLAARWFNVRVNAQWFIELITRLLEPGALKGIGTAVADNGVPSSFLKQDHLEASPKAAGAKVRNYLIGEMKKSPKRRPKPRGKFTKTRSKNSGLTASEASCMNGKRQ